MSIVLPALKVAAMPIREFPSATVASVAGDRRRRCRFVPRGRHHGHSGESL
jgi:hypothetical protein